MQEGRQNIVIVGAGFGGLRAALDLARSHRQLKGRRLVLVDRNSYHLFTPWLYERATTGAPSDGVKIPLAAIVGRRPIELVRGEVTEIDRRHKRITLASGQAIDYEVLILAPGSVANDYGIPGLTRFAHFLKSYQDAEQLREGLRRDYKQFLIKRQPSALYQVLIGGGGLTGVELAGEVERYLAELTPRRRRRARPYVVKLIEASPSLLGSLPAWAAQAAHRRLSSFRNVEVILQSSIAEVTDRHVTMNSGDRYEYECLIWTGGVRASPLVGGCGSVGVRGRAKVGSTLALLSDPNVYVVGDASLCRPQGSARDSLETIQTACEQGRLVAANVLRKLESRILIHFTAHPTGHIVPIGGGWGISTIGIPLVGRLAFVLLRLVHLRYFLSILPPLAALKRWSWRY